MGTVTLPSIFWIFLKTGSVLFGSGYVLLAFLRADLVERYGWLTEGQLLDAIAVGQLTPGPVFTTATFVGYLLAGPSGALVENRDVRGLHPMMAQRMELWRLANFELERLPASPDVYLFRAVARDNPRDERLVAVAEVRDLTPVRDDEGRIAALPEMERIARDSFEAMRSAQSRRPARQRLLWNRLQLYAWPTIEIRPEEAGAVIGRYARETAGLSAD